MNEISVLKKAAFDLIEYTTPAGKEQEVITIITDYIRDEINEIEIDEKKNLIINIGSSRTIFTAHTDTFGMNNVKTEYHHSNTTGLITGIGKTIIGADDKAGCIVLIGMIRAGVPGKYIFFAGEEKGRIGSSFYAKENKENLKTEYDRIISFDRKNVVSVITSQMRNQCTSKKFSSALAKKMSMYEDDGGSYTDSASFTEIISECTNISTGFYNEHTTNEIWNYRFTIYDLLRKTIKCNWEDLPTLRNPTKPPRVDRYIAYSYGYNTKYPTTYKEGSTYRKCEYCKVYSVDTLQLSGLHICKKCYSVFGEV